MSREPIAIVGIGCRFPGGADDPDRFWRLLCDGVDAIGDIPPDRFDAAELVDPDRGPGRIVSQEGGFLEGIDLFDAEFFGISPREAASIDPQQRLLLEVGWEALEDAGLVPASLAGSKTGVFVGVWAGDFEDLLFRGQEDIDLYVTTGGGRYAASGRLSFAFDLRGPSMTVDTACSSSLVTVHLACSSIWNGEADLALAGGVNVIVEPSISIGYSRSTILSQDGRCRFGDEAAAGYVRSEGAGIVVLKPLSAALANGDPVYALVRGAAVNNDGRSSGLLVAPGPQGQIEMLRDAYRCAGVDPREVGYVEAHGTGTRAGDAVELEALDAVLGHGRPAGSACPVGSVKTNIGHTESASGVAGLIKAALCLRREAIPPSLHFRTPSPRIPWESLGLRVQTELVPWARGARPRFAGVNSFGITGTNAHVVLEEPPLAERVPRNASSALVPFSAATEPALRTMAADHARALRAAAPPLADVASTRARRRSHLAERIAVVASDAEELADVLERVGNGEQDPRAARPGPEWPGAGVVFVFPGQGSQWPGMGRGLAGSEPVFGRALERCEEAMRPFVDWSLSDQLATEPDSAGYRLEEIDVVQPALLSIEIALAELWRSFGVEPAAVVGHSMGEVAAAHVAGALTLEDAMRVICVRSRLLREIAGCGAMAVVELPLDVAEAEIGAYGGTLSVAVSNSPRSTVVAGDPAALETLLEKLTASGVYCRPVKVDVASHSPQVDPLLGDLRAELAPLVPHAAAVPIVSTVDASPVEGALLDAAYWARNLRQPVRFGEAIGQLLEQGHTHFLELSPHPILLPAVDEIAHDAGRRARTLSSLRREQPERRALLESLAAAYADGCPIRWEAVDPGGSPVSLPCYPWQRERHWPALRRSARGGAGDHVLLDRELETPQGLRVREAVIDLAELPFLADHAVAERVVFPAAGYLDLALAAFGTVPAAVEAVSFHEALFLEEGTPAKLQVSLTPQPGGSAAFEIAARTEGAEQGWRLHASGTVRSAGELSRSDPNGLPPGRQPSDAGELYRELASRRLAYGPAFRPLQVIRRDPGRADAELAIPEGPALRTGPFRAHPVLLDGCLQLVVASVPSGDDLLLPVSVDRVELRSPLAAGATYAASAVARETSDGVEGDAVLRDASGTVVAAISGVRLRRVAAVAGSERLLREVRWEPAGAIPAQGRHDERWLLLCPAGGAGEALAAQLEGLGARCDLAEDLELDRFDLTGYAGVAHLWSLGVEGVAPRDAEERCCSSVVRLVQALDEAGAQPRLVLVTRGCQAVGDASEVAVAPALLWGLGAVLANERPGMAVVRVDLDPSGGLDEQALLAAELFASDEDAVAHRDGQRYAARLAQLTVDSGDLPTRDAPDGVPFALQIAEPGVLDRLRVVRAPRRSPGPGEVEIEVEAAALNFIDVMKAMGVYPGLDPAEPAALGGECAGRVAAVGDGAGEWAIGDEVVAVTPSFRHAGLIASHVVVPAELVARKPAGLSFAEAVTLPVAFLTARLGLVELGRLQAGERVLVHSAAGGVGLAAIQVARQVGAEVLATAGSEDKRQHLRRLGIEHVMDSRSLSFVEETLAATGGRGVDVVLNSLAGEGLRRSFEALAPYGRFVEIGKRDIYADARVGLLPFARSLSFSALDLARDVEERPAAVGLALREIVADVEAGRLEPLPADVLPLAEAEAAFRTMAQGVHIGKLVLDVRARPVTLAGEPPCRDDSTYLVTGGLGALGLEAARCLADQGAGTLVLAGRSEPGAAAQAVIAELEARGVRVAVERTDVSREEDVRQLLARIRKELPPLKGILHAAGVLDDGLVEALDPERLRNAIGPKADGAWNLHTATVGDELDWFCLYSSAAALLGIPGQGNYAAANAYLDALAHHRHGLGLPATSLNWGPWSEIGLAAADARRGERLAERGLPSIEVSEGAAALGSLLGTAVPQAAVMRLDATRWAESHPAAVRSSLLRGEEGASSPVAASRGAAVLDLLQAADPARRPELLEAHVREQVATVLRLPTDRVPGHTPLRSLGMDSLMTLELRNRLEASLGLRLSSTLVFNYPTVTAIATHLVGRLYGSAPTGQPEVAPDAEALDGLGADEVRDLLDLELAALERRLAGGA